MNVKNSDNASLLFVRDDGNVGLGTSSPEQKLAINGRVRIGTETITAADHTDYMLSVDGKMIDSRILF
jgi:hypothetical protein